MSSHTLPVGTRRAPRTSSRARPRPTRRAGNGTRRASCGRSATRIPTSPRYGNCSASCQYRLGNYPAATKELIASADLSRSVEQHPVLMDCWRAQRRFDKVEELWTELRSRRRPVRSSPRAASCSPVPTRTAGQLQLAIETLARHADDVKHVEEFHLRLWYTLADLYERAGEIPKAARVLRSRSARDSSFRGRRGTAGHARLTKLSTRHVRCGQFPDPSLPPMARTVRFRLVRCPALLTRLVRLRGGSHVRQPGRRPRYLFESGRGP